MQKNAILVVLTRVCVAMVLLVWYVGGSIPASAQEASKELAPISKNAAGAASPSSDESAWGDKTPPEHYVRSKAPSKTGQPYNYVQMGYASIVILFMAGVIVWLIRRHSVRSE